ncbi:unnamed protein product [Schistocephalus solidus]|uniref:Uncharacterized protein n=1 Tax=Schistocephalus solidus TaxID=70667 RepID=A0A183SIZ1_SCHSO|nr:unnamed protein product [Schistocephalus solidus]
MGKWKGLINSHGIPRFWIYVSVRVLVSVVGVYKKASLGCSPARLPINCSSFGGSSRRDGSIVAWSPRPRTPRLCLFLALSPRPQQPFTNPTRIHTYPTHQAAGIQPVINPGDRGDGVSISDLRTPNSPTCRLRPDNAGASMAPTISPHEPVSPAALNCVLRFRDGLSATAVAAAAAGASPPTTSQQRSYPITDRLAQTRVKGVDLGSVPHRPHSTLLPYPPIHKCPPASAVVSAHRKKTECQQSGFCISSTITQFDVQ